MMEWLGQANQNYITVALFILGLPLIFIFGLPAVRAQRESNIEKVLLDTRTWHKTLGDLQTDTASRYFAAIKTSTGWFNRVYGKRLLGWHALERAVTFALAYTVLAMIIGWILFGVGRLGGVTLLSEKLPWWNRLSVPILLLISTGLIAINQSENLLRKNAIANFFGSRKVAGIVSPIFVLVASFFLLNNDVYISFQIAFTVCMINSLFLLSFSLVELSNTRQLVFSNLFGVITLISISFFSSFFEPLPKWGIEAFGTIFLFIFLLPLLNAFADFLSIAATRYFLQNIAAKRKTALQVLGGVFIDLFIAMCCLWLLLESIKFTLDLWSSAAPASLPFNWRTYRDTLCAGNWQDGTMLWLMLATTLAPTALHLAAGLGAIWSHRAHIDSQIDAILRPSYDALRAKRSVEKGDGALARRLLTAAQLQTLVDLMGRKQGAQFALSIALFIGFMVAMMGLVYLAASTVALPYLCPAP